MYDIIEHVFYTLMFTNGLALLVLVVIGSYVFLKTTITSLYGRWPYRFSIYCHYI